MGKRVSIEIGERVHRLVVVAADRPSARGEKRVVVLCDCGAQKSMSLSHFRGGTVVSCGCYNAERTVLINKARATHGKTGTTEFRIWEGMKARCSNPRHAFYRYYGGRGITVCDRWLCSFDNFLSDMGPRPSRDYTLDRINNDGDYEPNNCRWATKEQQNSNRRSSHFLIVGDTQLTISQWSMRTGLTRATITSRLKRGLAPEQAVSIC